MSILDDLHRINKKYEKGYGYSAKYDFLSGAASDELLPHNMISPFILKPTDKQKEKLMKIHRKRSKRAQKIDESKNANITLDEKKWKKKPNRYDIPGIDTISQDVQRKRAFSFLEKAVKKNIVSEAVEDVDLDAKGAFDLYTKKIIFSTTHEDLLEPSTIAHELGHALDVADISIERAKRIRDFRTVGTKSSSAVSKKAQSKKAKRRRKQFIQISEFMRGGIPEDEYKKYREDRSELYADAVASTIIQPSYTKKHFPEVYETITNALKEHEL